MKDPNLKIREAFFALLDGNITSGGSPVPFANEMVDDSVGYPRLVVTEQSNTDWSCLTHYGNEHIITFEIVDKDRLGNKRIDEIAKQLKPILFSNLDLSPDFASAVTMLDSELTFKLPTEDGTGIIVRQISVKIYLREVNSI